MVQENQNTATAGTTATTDTTNSSLRSPSSNLQLISSPKASLFDVLDAPLLYFIISYVGINQYRFVASINKRFKNSYMKTFPGNTSTYWNISTMAHTQICAAEISPHNTRLCKFAAKNGHLEVIQYCRSLNCPWDAWTCAYAAGGGHLEVVQWCQQNGCPWDLG